MIDNTTLNKIVKAIVKEQVSIIGPMAIERANKVNGVKLNGDLTQIEINGEAKAVLENLVRQYSNLFGQASVEACKDSIKEVGVTIARNDLPAILQ